MAEESFQNNFFDTEYLKADLKGRLVRGGAIMMAAQSAKFFLQMVSTVVLARLLTPADFGLIAMVTALTGFAMIFKDLGLSMATIQKQDINHTQISTLFWVNVTLGLVIASAVTALAPVVAWFYGEPRLMHVTMALSGTFVFSGLTVQHEALLRRHMRFFALGLVTIIAMAIGVASAIVAGLCGAGYWALVSMHVVIPAATAGGVWIAFRWLPRLPKRQTGVREMLGFGGNVTCFNLINYFHRNLDHILLGKFWGASVLGLYSRAYGLIMLPTIQLVVPIESVALPGLSRLQLEPDRFRKYYKQIVSVLAFMNMPIVVFLAVNAKECIVLILGDQWVQAIPIFQVLAILALIQPIASTRGVVLISLGRTRRFLIWGIIYAVPVTVSFVIGIPWGAIGVATCYVAANYLLLPFSLFYCFSNSPVKVSDFYNAVLPSLLSGVCMGIVLYLGKWWLRDSSIIVVLGACMVLALFSYFFFLMLIPGGRSILYDVRDFILLLIQKRK